MTKTDIEHFAMKLHIYKKHKALKKTQKYKHCHVKNVFCVHVISNLILLCSNSMGFLLIPFVECCIIIRLLIFNLICNYSNEVFQCLCR